MKELFKDKSAPIRVICLAAAVITLILGFLNGALNLSFLEKDTYMYARGSESFLSAYYTLCALTAAISAVLYAVLRIKKLDASAPLLSVKEKSERSVAWVLR